MKKLLLNLLAKSIEYTCLHHYHPVLGRTVDWPQFSWLFSGERALVNQVYLQHHRNLSFQALLTKRNEEILRNRKELTSFAL